MTQQFGIIGFPLDHSLSAQFFNTKFAEEGIDANYLLYPIQNIGEFQQLCEQVEFTGLNVTYPYKEAIIPYLDELDESAKAIDAVNVIHFVNGKKIGYNTDSLGFINSLRPLLQPHHTRALVLGTGGAAKAVWYGLKALGIPYTCVSRDPNKGITYEDLTPQILREHPILINTTPVGMFPDVQAYIDLPMKGIDERHLVYDVIYNPAKTRLLAEAEVHGATIHNGLDMLLGQASAAWDIWL